MGQSNPWRRQSAAALALLTGALCVPAPAFADGGGALRTSHRETVAACRYAEQHGASSARRACLRVESARTLSAAATTSYQNPIYGSAPDPMAALDGGVDYYAYHTGGGFPVLHSTDLVNWSQVRNALEARPSWVVATGDWHPWSPSVIHSSAPCPGPSSPSPGCYFLYYTGLHGSLSPATHCVAVAYSATPAGPFSDLGPLTGTSGQVDGSGRPPGCGDDLGYSNIDPAPFVNGDGRVYLYVATNRACAQISPGSACPFSPSVSVLALSGDLMHVAGPRTRLFSGVAGSWEQQAGEGPKVEGPWLEKRSSTYYLFYSGGSYPAAKAWASATRSSPAGRSRSRTATRYYVRPPP